MTTKSIAELIQHHEKQVELYTLWAALAEEEGDDEKTAAHLGFRDLHKQWADELREFGTTLVDHFDALTRPLLSRPLFTQPLNVNHARHA
ncbi:MAG: hypothetical protein K0R17_3610 [Rariglobus sp.]|jgi:hypothetical protein|nr:hypothetical protein [Rariglobus sp.]